MENNNKINIGKKIKKLRNNKKLSQQELGKKIGITGTTIGEYEREETYPPIKNLKKLCDFFNVSADYLIGNTEEPRPVRELQKTIYSYKPYMKLKNQKDIKIVLKKLLNLDNRDIGNLLKMINELED